MEFKTLLTNLFSHLFFNNIQEKFQPIEAQRLLWNKKPIREDSVLLWDLENIGFNRLSEIKRVVKYTPETCYVITTQKLSAKKREEIESEHFQILDAHKTISDDKIISLMKLYRDKKEMVLISSDSDFSREANRYLKNNRLHWIVSEYSKKRVTMFVKLDSPNLTLSTISLKEKTVTSNKKRVFKKHQPFKRKMEINGENRYGVQTYLLYYKGRVKALFQRIILFFTKRQTNRLEEHQERPLQTKKSKKGKNKISKKFGLHINTSSGISYRYIFRINFRRRMTVCGKVQYNPNKEILLMLHNNLNKKYIMPSYEKLIRVEDERELQTYVKYESQRDIYLLNDFKRADTDSNEIIGSYDD